MIEREDQIIEELEPDIQHARQTANVAHGIVIKLKEMGLPQEMDGDLASLCTDLGDLWSAQKTLSENLEEFLKTDGNWETIGNHLVDIRSNIDHMAWHLKTVRRPLNKITQHAYREADKLEG